METNSKPNATTQNEQTSTKRTHQTYADVMDINEPTEQSCMDQTGLFPLQ
jgi:hypothetical protein